MIVPMRRARSAGLTLTGVVVMAAIVDVALASGRQTPWVGVLEEHPAIQYASRPTTDRVARLIQSLAQQSLSRQSAEGAAADLSRQSAKGAAADRTLQRDERTGHLMSVLDALGVPVESQLLVFSKTGVQRAYTSPHNPRALFYNESVVVGYVPGAPLIEIASLDPQQAVIFYTVDQAAAAPTFVRGRSCLSCHVSSSTLDVPGLITRSNVVADDGTPLPRLGSNDVNHQTPHPDRWGGWYVTSEGAPPPYSQRAHGGNITFSPRGDTSNQVFTDWLTSSPEMRGYPSANSDIVSLLVFDHQARAINLMSRLNWEARVAASEGHDAAADNVRRLAIELADYLLFAGEAPAPVPLTPRPGFAARLERATPKDRQGRSFGQLLLTTRLFRYPCSYMVYSEAFDGLPAAVKTAIYSRMIDTLSSDTAGSRLRVSADDRRAILEILRDTKADFPSS